MTDMSPAISTLTTALGTAGLGSAAAAATLAAAATAVSITADGNRIVLNYADLNAALELWKPWGSAAKRTDFLKRFEEMLQRLNVSVEFRVEGRHLGGIGPGTQPGLLRRLIA